VTYPQSETTSPMHRTASNSSKPERNSATTWESECGGGAKVPSGTKASTLRSSLRLAENASRSFRLCFARIVKDTHTLWIKDAAPCCCFSAARCSRSRRTFSLKSSRAVCRDELPRKETCRFDLNEPSHMVTDFVDYQPSNSAIGNRELVASQIRIETPRY